MTTQVSPKIRLVRCARCRKVLPEWSGMSLYLCGGCGAILVAKNRTLETNRTEVPMEETYTVAGSQQDDVSEEKELAGAPPVESSPDIDNLSGQDDHGDCSMEPREERSASNDLSDSLEVPHPRDTSLEVRETLKQNNLLGQISKRFDCKFHDENGEWIEGSSSVLPCSGELIHEAEVYAPGAIEHVKQHGKSHLHQDNEARQIKGGESQEAWLEGDNCVDDLQYLPDLEYEESVLASDSEDRDGNGYDYIPPENDEKSQISSSHQNRDSREVMKLASLDSSSGLVIHGNGNVSQQLEESVEVDDESEEFSTFRSPRTEEDMNTSGCDSIVASQRSLNESLSSFYLTCSEDEHLDHSPREGSHNFGRVSSADTLGMGSSALADLSSELNLKHGSMTNNPTAGGYQVHDGSESFYDGTNDQIYEHVPLRKSKDLYYSSITEVREDTIRVDNVVNSEPERDCWATSSSHRARKKSHWASDESIDANGYTSGNSLRLDKQGAASRLPITSSRDTLIGHRTVGPSNYRHNFLPPRPGFNSSDKASYSEADRMELLRTVCDLKDQLSRMHFPKGTRNRRFLAGVGDPLHSDHSSPQQEMYAGLNLANVCPERYISRQGFSGEAAHYRDKVSCFCLGCHPQDWCYSAQLPTHSMHCKNGRYGVHSETKSDNQRHDAIKRSRLQEKYNTARRLVRPVAGGAPIIACYHCSELLQLPADFLLFKRRYHQLMCNACRKVMKFSLLKGTRIVPYPPDDASSQIAPPPGEADNFNDSTGLRNLEPISHSSSAQHVEAVSGSDYGQSFGRSCSTEGEASVVLPSFDHVERKPYIRKMSSSSSYEPMEDRKMKSVLRESQHKNDRLPKTTDSVETSSKIPRRRKATSEIEELPPPPSNPLPRLLRGHLLPSQMLNLCLKTKGGHHTQF